MLGSLATRRMVLMIASALLAGLVSIFVFWKPASGDATVPTGFTDEQFGTATGFLEPMAMEFAPDGRLFVAERLGKIRVIEEDGTLLQKPFVSIPRADHLDTQRQRGIQGITFHPDFPTDPTDSNNRYVYVHYTQEDPNGGPSHNRIVRFTEVAAGAGATEPTNEALEAGDSGGDPGPKNRLPFELDNLGESLIHNGGHIEFGNDGKLYVPVGDNQRNRQPPVIENLFSLDHFFGKVLRINDDGSVPRDNPFFDKASGTHRAIYARGFKEPFSMGVEPAPGNRIYINDVGNRTWEEINNLRAGKNYGYPVCEGEGTFKEPLTGECPDRFTDPIFAYQQNISDPEGTPGPCAITAGTFYPESGPFPAKYEGDFFFADLCAGWIKAYDPATDSVSEPLATGTSAPIDLKVGPDGGLYYLERGTSSVRVIRAD